MFAINLKTSKFKSSEIHIFLNIRSFNFFTVSVVMNIKKHLENTNQKLKILGLITDTGKYQKKYNNFCRRHKSRI